MPSYSRFLVQNRILEIWKLLEIEERQFNAPNANRLTSLAAIRSWLALFLHSFPGSGSEALIAQLVSISKIIELVAGLHLAALIAHIGQARHQYFQFFDFDLGHVGSFPKHQVPVDPHTQDIWYPRRSLWHASLDFDMETIPHSRTHKAFRIIRSCSAR